MGARDVRAGPAPRLAGRRQAWRRLRWRMRGAWQWPAFFAFTLLDGAVLALLPFYGAGPGGYVAGVLLAGFANLVLVAVAAPLAGRVVRRRRPDLPRLVAANYAGTGLVVALGALLLLGGILHRPATRAGEAERQSAVAAMRDFVRAQEPALRGRLSAIDLLEIEPRLYRACVPGMRTQRWLCVFVSTAQAPPGIRRDPDEEPNDVYRIHGGFR
jgi:hypothetical protein